jgi:tetratricopeptide (TPR) repeat protein
MEEYMSAAWYWLWVINCFFCCVPLYAQEQELFLRGNEYYAAGKYDEALCCYQQIPDKWPAVFYNIGNCCYHKDQPVDAFVWWSRAERNALNNDLFDIQANKVSVYKKLNMSLPSNENCIRSIPVFRFQCLALMAWVLVLVFFCFFRGIIRVVLVMLSISLLFFVCHALYVDYCMRSMVYGYTCAESVPVYVGPGIGYHSAGALPAATRVEIDDQRPEWFAVRVGKMRGWIRYDAVEVV